MKCFTHEDENCSSPGCRSLIPDVDPPIKRIAKLEAALATAHETAIDECIRVVEHRVSEGLLDELRQLKNR